MQESRLDVEVPARHGVGPGVAAEAAAAGDAAFSPRTGTTRGLTSEDHASYRISTVESHGSAKVCSPPAAAAAAAAAAMLGGAPLPPAASSRGLCVRLCAADCAPDPGAVVQHEVARGVNRMGEAEEGLVPQCVDDGCGASMTGGGGGGFLSASSLRELPSPSTPSDPSRSAPSVSCGTAPPPAAPHALPQPAASAAPPSMSGGIVGGAPHALIPLAHAGGRSEAVRARCRPRRAESDACIVKRKTCASSTLSRILRGRSWPRSSCAGKWRCSDESR
mmetsp:Transcript_7613/g.25020  ORF Transcript_7613/g.25020 Transcript_7613/m.25020 type:complete len:277 (+) Transcript_7613:789-1619(+)